MTKEDIQPYIDQGYVNAQRHPEFPLTIYNYSKKCQYDGEWNDITRQCRGLILDDDGNIVARPFPKFFNYGEHEPDDMPNETPVITKKADGSLGIVYYWDDKWHVATRGSFSSDQAIWATKWMQDNITEDVPGLNSALPLNRFTILCEIIYHENRIVVKYQNEELVYLATIDNETGKQELNGIVPWGMRRVLSIPHGDISVLLEMDIENEEGFVVYYPDANFRMKIKFPEYMRLHRLVTGVNAKTIWEMLRDKKPLDELLERVPDEFNQWVRETVKDLDNEYGRIEIYAAEFAKRANRYFDTRKEQAIWINENVEPRFRGVVFRMPDNKDPWDIIWKHIRPVAEKPFANEV